MKKEESLESEDEEILEGLLEEKEKSSEKGSVDEENVSENDDSFFDMKNLKSDSSPSLGQVAVSSGLENQIFSSGGSDVNKSSSKESDEFKYDTFSKGDEDDKKYISYEGGVRDVSAVDMEKLGRNSFVDAGSEVAFISSREVEVEEPLYEKKYDVKSVDVENLGRENPFEKEVKLYKERPKSF